jgi:hypothetical protein
MKFISMILLMLMTLGMIVDKGPQRMVNHRYAFLALRNMNITTTGKCFSDNSQNQGVNCGPTAALALIGDSYTGTPVFTDFKCRILVETNGNAGDVMTFNMHYTGFSDGAKSPGAVFSETLALDTMVDGELYEATFYERALIANGNATVEWNATAGSPFVADMNCTLRYEETIQ